MKKGTYIIYDPETYKLIETFDWFCHAEDYALETGYKCINRTHPKNKSLVEKILNLKEIDEQLTKLFEEIDNEDFENAHFDLNKLKEKVGKDNPELIRAEWLIKFLE